MTPSLRARPLRRRTIAFPLLLWGALLAAAQGHARAAEELVPPRYAGEVLPIGKPLVMRYAAFAPLAFTVAVEMRGVAKGRRVHGTVEIDGTASAEPAGDNIALVLGLRRVSGDGEVILDFPDPVLTHLLLSHRGEVLDRHATGGGGLLSPEELREASRSPGHNQFLYPPSGLRVGDRLHLSQEVPDFFHAPGMLDVIYVVRGRTQWRGSQALLVETDDTYPIGSDTLRLAGYCLVDIATGFILYGELGFDVRKGADRLSMALTMSAEPLSSGAAEDEGAGRPQPEAGR